MISKFLLPVFCSFFITLTCFANQTIDGEPQLSKDPAFDNLIGYEYNLWGVKAENRVGSSEYEYTGRLFLDKRQDYKATHDEDEHFFFFKKKFANEEVFKIPGSGKSTKFISKGKIDKYYVALKFGPQWKHHQLRDILKNIDQNVGADVGCKDCNYKKNYYDLETDWSLTVYYRIKPIFKETETSDSQMAKTLLLALSEKEGFSDVAVVEQKTKIGPPKKIDTKLKEEKKVISMAELPVNNVEEKPEIIFKPIPEIIEQNLNSYHVLFRVLNDPHQTFDDLTHLGPLYKETFDDKGSTRYLIGNSTSLEEAKALEQKVKAAGYNSTILAAYKNGQLKDYIDSDIATTKYPEKTYTNTYARQQESTINTDNSEGYGRSIQFTAIGNGSKSFSQLAHLGKVYAEKVEGKKLYRYKLKVHNNLNESAVVDEVKGLGFTGAFIVK